MIVFRRRLIFWLLKAYIKKWRKVIALSFIIGLIIFFGFLKISAPLFQALKIHTRQSIGIAGVYTVESLPPSVIQKLTRGLTKVADDGTIKPDLATAWEIRDNGKTYVFYLKKDVYFSDNTPLTSSTVTYDFSDVKVERPNRYTIVYKLNDPYSPFLVTVSSPIFKKGLVGIGEYTIDKIELNGQFLTSLRLTHVRDKAKSEDYHIYPTQEAIKVAFALGEIRKIEGITNDTFKDTTFQTFPNVSAERKLNQAQLVTLFYNNRDGNLSDKKIRSALTYGLPSTFEEGERTYVPYNKSTWFYNNELSGREQDYVHAKELLSDIMSGTGSAQLSFTMKVLQKYTATAQKIKTAWEPLGVQVTIESVDTIPNDFQMYLGDFSIPKDPDQYTLWHSDQRNNITGYKNLRIDKFLEDGRKTVDVNERTQIYKEFQKYLLDDSPASFLYYPYEYTLTRK